VRRVVKAMRILVCDDDKSCRKAIVEVLHTDGFETYEAAGGYEALKLVRAVPVDFGFVDCSLPDLDGPTALRRMREESITFPVVLMSGEKLFAEACLATAGLVAFLSKPLDVGDIRKILQDYFGPPPAEERFGRGFLE